MVGAWRLWHSRSHLKIEFFLLFIVNIDESWSFICFYWVDAMKSSWIMSLIRFANLFLPFIWFDHSKIQNHWLKLNIVEKKIAFCWRLKHQSFQISTFLNVISHLILIWFFSFFFLFFLCLQTLITGYNLVRNAWTHWIALCVYEFWCVHAFADTNFDLKMHAFFSQIDVEIARCCPMLRWLTLSKHTLKSMSQMMKITHKINIQKNKNLHTKHAHRIWNPIWMILIALNHCLESSLVNKLFPSASLSLSHSRTLTKSFIWNVSLFFPCHLLSLRIKNDIVHFRLAIFLLLAKIGHNQH